MLGKRKREFVVVKRAPAPTSDDDVSRKVSNTLPTVGNTADLFRKYFEESFNPLPASGLATTTPSSYRHTDDTEDEESEDDEGIVNGNGIPGDTSSDWSGFSDTASNTTQVQIVDHTAVERTHESDPIDKIFQKSFMTSKPPHGSHAQPRADESLASQDEDESTNLKHDLDLQRLLRESHLLEQTKKRSNNGGQRHKATDLRMQSLGSRASLFTQESMPMSHRRGILAKASQKDAHRRKEARESGIVLENPSKKKSSTGPKKRDRGVDVPVVGTFRDGTLQLSRRDIASIQGRRRVGAKKVRSQ